MWDELPRYSTFEARKEYLLDKLDGMEDEEAMLALLERTAEIEIVESEEEAERLNRKSTYSNDATVGMF